MRTLSMLAVAILTTTGCGAAPPEPPGARAPGAALRGDAGCGPQVALQGDGLLVSPGGEDDTAALQCALDRGSGGTVRLAPGTFRIALVVANGFRGRLVGAGAARTTIRNVDRTIPVAPLDYWREPPSASNPWPALISFVDGSFTVSDLAIRIHGEYPVTEWVSHGWGSRAMGMAINVTGSEADATLERLDIEGEPSPDPLAGFNLVNATFTWGIIGDDPLPLRARLSVRGSRFASVGGSVTVANLADSDVSITGNRFEGTLLAAEIIDLSRSRYRFTDNVASTYYLTVDQYDFCAGPSSVCGTDHTSMLVADNRIEGGPVVFEGTMGDGATCRIVDDEFGEMGFPFDVFLGRRTHDCLVTGTERVVDRGSGNRVQP